MNETSTLNPVPTRLAARSVRELINRASPPALSLYVPLVTAADGTEQLRLSVKNLLADARRQLGQWPVVDHDALLQGLTVDDGQWWPHTARGWAHFAARNGVSETYFLPYPVEPRVDVGAQFAIRDLIAAVQEHERFHLLSISQNHVQLYHGDRFSLAPHDTAIEPASLATARANFEHDNALTRHGGGPPGPTGRPFEGVHGQGSDHKATELAEYFHAVDRAVCDIIGPDSKVPLLLAMDAPLAPIYRSVSHYESLVSTPVAGNHDHCSLEELHRHAWPYVAPLFEADRTARIFRYREHVGTHLAAASLSDILVATAMGRVDTLFVTTERPVWGRFDPVNMAVSIDSEYHAGDEDLINRAIVQTIAHGGTAYSRANLDAPALAALYRY